MQLVLTRGFIPVSWHSGKGLFNLLRKNTLQYVYPDVNSANNSKHCLVTICPLVQSLINGMKITSHFLRDLKLPFPFLPLLSSSFIPSSPPSLLFFLSLWTKVFLKRLLITYAPAGRFLPHSAFSWDPHEAAVMLSANFTVSYIQNRL